MSLTCVGLHDSYLHEESDPIAQLATFRIVLPHLLGLPVYFVDSAVLFAHVVFFGTRLQRDLNSAESALIVEFFGRRLVAEELDGEYLDEKDSPDERRNGLNDCFGAVEMKRLILDLTTGSTRGE